MPSAKGARNAAIWGAQTVQDGEKRVLGEYDTGYNEAKGYLRQGDEYYKPYADRYGAGSEAYSNALGLGGEAGNQSALGMFQSSPLARLMKDNAQQDSQGILRKASAGGMLNSGNTDTDVMSYMAGLYNKTYGDHLGRLGEMDQRGLQTAQLRNNNLGNLAGLASNYYNQRGSTIQDNINNITGMGMGAFKAGDDVKAKQEANWAAGGKALASLMGSGMGSGGLFTKIFTGGK
jgi:hypothetical protein